MDIKINFALRLANNERFSTMYIYIKTEQDFIFVF